MLGLLVLDERWQRRGLGRRTVEWPEHCAGEHEECTKIRLGVVANNSNVLGICESMDYRRTDVMRPFDRGNVESEVIVFEMGLAVDV